MERNTANVTYHWLDGEKWRKGLQSSVSGMMWWKDFRIKKPYTKSKPQISLIASLISPSPIYIAPTKHFFATQQRRSTSKPE
jgi:hypothetical protein